MPKISVIVPVYKVEKYLNHCVDSILNQTFTDFELVLVDDGSPDNCGKICDGYALKDHRVKVIHKRNGGLSDARNTGIDWVLKNSDSQWLTFVDSDDWIHERMLEIMFETNLNNQTEICMGLLSAKYEEGSERAPIDAVAIVKTPEDAWSDFSCNVTACCKLYAKKLFADIRFPIGKLHEDTYTTHKVVFQARSISVISAIFYFCALNPDSITRSAWNPKRLDVIGAFNEQHSFFEERGLKKAYISSCHGALTYYSMMLNEINRKKYPQETKLLIKEMRRVMKQNKQLLGLSPSKNSFYYDSAYPIEMKFYWYYKIVKNKVLKIWFNVYDNIALLKLKFRYPLHIMSSKKTINYILKNNCSIARYGDGEFGLMMQTDFVPFQGADEQLAKALTNVLSNENKDLLICFPYPIESMQKVKKGNFWRSWTLGNKENLVVYIRSVMKDANHYVFGDACISRPYTVNHSDKKTIELFSELKKLWQDRDVLFVEGESTCLGIGNDLFDNCKSIKRILAPAKNAFDVYPKILNSIISHWNGELIIIALGPTATVLASDLSKNGMQALDMGHIDVQYEWFRQGEAFKPLAMKFASEGSNNVVVQGCEDEEYLSQIIERING